jgi:hypothetical protein
MPRTRKSLFRERRAPFPGILWRRLDAGEAHAVLVDCYGRRAGMEALERAIVCERRNDGAGARFWVAVYCGIHVARYEAAPDPTEDRRG